MRIDVVIVNWNAGPLLSRCIDSVFTAGNNEYTGTCFVVDNASSDDSIALVNKREKLVIIKNQVNVGFAKACNQAFSMCKEEFVLLLNPDAQLEADTLQKCMVFMQQNEKVDIMGACHKNDDGKIVPSCSRFPTPLTILHDATGLSRLWPHIFKPATLMTDWDHAESRKVDQVMGAFMCIRRKLFKTLGYFDERYFVYFEELDFSKQLADKGGISFYNRDICIQHTGGGTTRNVKSFRLFLFLRSRIQYALKHFDAPGAALVYLASWLIEPFSRMVLAIVSGRPKDIGAVLNAYRMLLFTKKPSDS